MSGSRLTVWDRSIALSRVFGTSILPCFRGAIFQREYFLYNIDADRLTEVPKDCFPYRIGGDVLLREDENVIARIDSYKYTIQWEFAIDEWKSWASIETSTRVSIMKLIGTNGDDLWLGLNNGKVLILSAATGQLKIVLKDVFEATSSRYMDKEAGKVVGLFMHSYWEVDLITRDVVFIDLTADFGRQGIYSFGILEFDGHHIYFFDKDNGKVGAFDRNTKRLVWEHRLSQESGNNVFPMDLHKYGDRLCVLDNAKTLHVLKRSSA